MINYINKFLKLALLFFGLNEFNKSVLAQDFEVSDNSNLFSGRVSAYVKESTTWTDNFKLSNSNEYSALIIEISPGISIQKPTGRVKGDFDISLNKYLNNKIDSDNSLQTQLNAKVSSEIINNLFYLDIGGSVSQKTISAFGVQSFNNINSVDNKTEVKNFSASPYLKGRILSFADYEIRHSAMATKAKSATSLKSNQEVESIKLSSDDFRGKLNWILNFSTIKSNVNSSLENSSKSINVSLIYPLIHNLDLSISTGREIVSISSRNTDNSKTAAANLIWTISETSKLSAGLENRALGKMHSFRFEHRTPRTSWTVSDIKSISTSTDLAQQSSINNTFDLLNNIYISIEPDPIKRAILVQKLMKNGGISSMPSSLNGYLSSGTSIQRVQNLSFALLGVRDTLTFSFLKSLGQRINGASYSSGDFVNSSEIKQNGIIANFSHKLTPDTSINFSASSQVTSGDNSNQKSRIRYFNINSSKVITKNISGSLGIRRILSASDNGFSYKESAVFGGLMVNF